MLSRLVGYGGSRCYTPLRILHRLNGSVLVHCIMSIKQRSNGYYLGILVALTAFVWITKYHPFLYGPFIFDADARQHVYWTYTFRDAELFRHDLLTDYISSPKVAPLGYQALYYVGARLMDPLLFSQFLSLLLALITVYLMFNICLPFSGKRGSAIAACLMLLCYFLYHYSGGLQRSFAFPLLLGGLYVLRQRAWWRLTAMLVLQSVLYPPVMINTAVLAVPAWWRSRRRVAPKTVWVPLLAVSLGLAIAAGIRFGANAVADDDHLGSIVSRSQARAMPEFAAHGRTSFFEATWWQTLLNRRAGLRIDRFYGLGGLLLTMWLLCGLSRFVVPTLAKDLLWTSLVPFILAHLVLFTLYLPARYLLFTFSLAVLVTIAANVDETLAALGRRWPWLLRRSTALARHRGRFWLALGVFALAFAYAQHRYFNLSEIEVDRTAMQLYHYLRTLPKDVLIAGHPLELNNVPLLSQRKVLANEEVAEAFYTDYYATVQQRLFDMLAAYYTNDMEQLQDFAQRYGVDYILVNTQHFKTPFLQGPIYYEPFGSFIRQQITSRQHFVLLEMPAAQRVYEDGPYIVVAVQGNRD